MHIFISHCLTTDNNQAFKTIFLKGNGSNADMMAFPFFGNFSAINITVSPTLSSPTS